MVIYNSYNNRPPSVKRKPEGKSITEKAGYIPPDIQVKQMLSAGILLQKSREGIYDSEIDDSFDDDAPLDRLDSRDVDMVDVHLAVQEAKERMESAEKDSKRPKKRPKKEEVKEVEESNESVIESVSAESNSSLEGDSDQVV